MAYNLARMKQILSYRRPHASKTLDEFLQTVIFDNYNVTVWKDDRDADLAFTFTVGEDSETLFSCHVDTMHRSEGMQVAAYDEEIALFYKPTDPSDDQCLGADDGAGIWLLLEMIDAGIPGTYIFHYGEERGGIGSIGMAEYHEEWLKKFKRAVAFDRRDVFSVITHQGMGRCCSDEFAEALSEEFNKFSMDMKPDDTGIFTDTANYIEYIPECTNISCGYEAEHTKGEILDFEFLCRLRDAVVQMDWESLVTVRTPEPIVMPEYAWGYSALSRKYDTNLDRIINMTYSEMTGWVRKSTIADITDMLYDAADRILDTENQLNQYMYEQEKTMCGKAWEKEPLTGGTAWKNLDEYDDEYNRLDVGMR